MKHAAVSARGMATNLTLLFKNDDTVDTFSQKRSGHRQPDDASSANKNISLFHTFPSAILAHTTTPTAPQLTDGEFAKHSDDIAA
ncbi:MAG: hypothetical protein JW384_03507 [Nitrosomonadaceae bacterium]|nr:hypothetical protein [Nitrosomonadaceae bacterium]